MLLPLAAHTEATRQAERPVNVVFGYLWFYLYAAWVYDAPTARKRWTRVGGLALINVVMALVFGVGLGWL